MKDDKQPVDADMSSKTTVSNRKSKIRLSYLGRNLLVKGENKRKFEELRARILKEIRPMTEIERVLGDKFISAVWNHDRTLEVERNMLNTQNQIKDGRGSDSRRRIRNIRKVSFGGSYIQKVLTHRIATEKNMLKMLERIREEQKLHPAKESEDMVHGTVR